MLREEALDKWSRSGKEPWRNPYPTGLKHAHTSLANGDIKVRDATPGRRSVWHATTREALILTMEIAGHSLDRVIPLGTCGTHAVSSSAGGFLLISGTVAVRAVRAAQRKRQPSTSNIRT